MIRTWTDEQKQFLRDNYGKLSHAEIAEQLGKPVGHVKSQASNMKITVSRKWADEDVQTLLELYPDTPTQELADRLGKGLTAVYRMAKVMGLQKSEAFRSSDASGRISKENRIRRGLEYRFPKGHVPANKGLRRPGYAPGRMGESQFKKGPNRPIGVKSAKSVLSMATCTSRSRTVRKIVIGG